MSEMAKIDKKALLPKAFLSIRVEYQSCTLDQNASKIILPTNALTTVTSCQSGVFLKMANFFEKLPEPVISAQRALSVMYCNDIRSILMSFKKIFPLSLFIGAIRTSEFVGSLRAPRDQSYCFLLSAKTIFYRGQAVVLPERLSLTRPPWGHLQSGLGLGRLFLLFSIALLLLGHVSSYCSFFLSILSVSGYHYNLAVGQL